MRTWRRSLRRSSPRRRWTGRCCSCRCGARAGTSCTASSWCLYNKGHHDIMPPPCLYCNSLSFKFSLSFYLLLLDLLLNVEPYTIQAQETNYLDISRPIIDKSVLVNRTHDCQEHFDSHFLTCSSCVEVWVGSAVLRHWAQSGEECRCPAAGRAKVRRRLHGVHQARTRPEHSRQ